MRNADELMDLRAERITLLAQLDQCSNTKRQAINKRLMNVSKKIQRLVGVSIVSHEKPRV